MFIYFFPNVLEYTGLYIPGDKMKLLGMIQDVGFDGKLIVRGAFAPGPRERVVDNRSKPLGFVRRVFGPVDSPYIIVEPAGKSNLLAAVGKQVYIEEVGYYAKGTRRDRRD
jgi:RNA-binding protein